ncbi:ABC transporter substrate-binding protein [Pseudoduganella namucuonensis]|uniref:Amino acid/amide ABC transporter substrate-binding protein, HAAT family n=1 Tax=Pseudoduganella namucuonensis TaxID=1035707 RepID=A0A1I7LPW3_9BURK|nr:ABC transporter substrate-binding protein [Pseudoduganella namucuonensis]SFV11600.1 amino acid/amide ABC transporter substrate-binding protein, HAAT family [Pseudoduganella namucuonensis]
MKIKILLSAVGLSLASLASSAMAENGVTATEIKIGMANALSGPTAGLGLGIKSGSAAYFKKVNATGGVNGRKITLVSEDDGYDPLRTGAATEKLIKKDNVFALFGYVGTPTSKAALSLAVDNDVPFFGPFTGAEFLRSPVNKYIFNIRSSYFNEIEMQVERLVSDAGVTKFGLFYQEDTYGKVGKEGLQLALQKRKMTIAAEGHYTRNTEDVDAGLAALLAAKPEAVLMVGTYKACAALVRKAHAAGYKPKFFNLSFVGTSNFIKAAGDAGEGVYITQVVPSPYDESIPIVKQYQADMKAAGVHEFDYTSFEGYIDAVALVEGLKKTGPDLTRANFLAALEKMSVNLGGLDIAFGPQDHQGLNKVYLTKVQQGKPVPVSKL